MMDRRLFWNGILLCLPAVALTISGGYFLYDKVPELAENEHRRVIAEYRIVAENLKEGEVEPDKVIVETTKRPRSARKMKPGRWDFEPVANGMRVWYAQGNKSIATIVPIIDEFDFTTPFYAVGGLFMLLFIGMTYFGVNYFWKFARERDDFLAATAHDLTTPLVGLRHSIGRNTEDAKFLNERMIRLVENIKDFLRLGGKRRNPDMTEFNIVDSFDEAYRIFREDYREFLNGNDIAKTFIGGNPTQMKVMADETMTIQILWNLLGNDLKYAIPYGGVEVRFVRTEKSVKVEFADEGQGMTARQMRKAFDRYYRAKTALASGKGGFGIGLCTAREFARAMGGDLTVRANAPKGCVFTLTLPSRQS